MKTPILDIGKMVDGFYAMMGPDYDIWLRKRDKFLRKEEELIAKHLRKKGIPLPVILDAGCGPGIRGKRIMGLLPGSVFYGYDRLESMVIRAKRMGYASAVKGDMAKPPQFNTLFDAITCIYFPFAHLADAEQRRAALTGFYLQLMPNGLLFIDVHNRWHTGEGLEFRKSCIRILYELAKSAISMHYGDIIFSNKQYGPPVECFSHLFSHREFSKLIDGLFTIDARYILGYDSGEEKIKEKEGNFLYVCRKFMPYRNCGKKDKEGNFH